MGAHFQGGVGSVPLRPFPKAPVIGKGKNTLLRGGGLVPPRSPFPRVCGVNIFLVGYFYFQTRVHIYNLQLGGRDMTEKTIVTHPLF